MEGREEDVHPEGVRGNLKLNTWRERMVVEIPTSTYKNRRKDEFCSHFGTKAAILTLLTWKEAWLNSGGLMQCFLPRKKNCQYSVLLSTSRKKAADLYQKLRFGSQTVSGIEQTL